MNSNKILIEKRFTKSIHTYKDNAIIQKTMALKLLNILKEESLNKKKFDDVFEFGCGCGLLTYEFFNNFSCTNYICNDIVKSCYDYIFNINKKIEFICADVENIELNKKFDLIISNATFQWLNNPKKTTNTLISNLKEDGILAFTTFGPYNLKEFKQLGFGLNYINIESIKSLFPIKDKNKIIIKDEIIQLHFKNPYYVLKHLKCSGVNAVYNHSFTKTKLKKFIDDYYKLFKTKDKNFVTLTYHPVYIFFKI